MLKIKYSDRVVGTRIGNTIYLHPKLALYPELERRVLLHEINHSDNFSNHDLLHDLRNKELKGKKLDFYRFILSHPKTLTNFLPLNSIDGKRTIAIPETILWILTIIFTILGISIII